MTSPTGTDSSVQNNGDRSITIATTEAVRQFVVSKWQARAFLTGTALVLVWTIAATAWLALSGFGSVRDVSGNSDAMARAYEARIAALVNSRDRYARDAQAASTRFDAAMSELARQHDDVMATGRQMAELSSYSTDLGVRFEKALSDRDNAESHVRELRGTIASLEQQAGTSPEQARELQVILSSVSDALRTAVRARDTQKQDMGRLESEIAAMELRMKINADRQERMIASLEDAVATSFGPLETMFKNSGMDVDSLVNSVRRNYSGIGGPLTEAAVSSQFLDQEVADRFSDLMTDMDHMNMMRIAATNIPYSMPVKVAHRFTSGFGMRRDPKTGGRRAHNGIDLAGPRGTPVVSTGDGVVSFAGRQSGFGNLIKIRHDYGFETLYAHLNKIHVKVGDRIARGDHIGDMGNTGRSTGVHLHYEVRQGGKPVNPMTYIKAARNVF